MEKDMRIAVCLFGQPRTWQKCINNWKEKFNHNGEIDYFFHFWDYNTLPSLLASQPYKCKIDDELISDDEKKQILDTLQPKKYSFESRKNIDYWNCDLTPDQKIGGWCTEQYYSLYHVSLLKKQYELENNFRYDVVIRLRADLFFLDEKIDLIKPKHNTIYTINSHFDERYNVCTINDSYFYADSYTFDQAALFYKFLSFVPKNWITSAICPPPEVATYFYFASIGLINHPTFTDIKFMRDQRVLAIKGVLDGYEIV
jgi:hypothetical protein